MGFVENINRLANTLSEAFTDAINSVGSNEANIITVANDIDNVNTVAGNISGVNSVATAVVPNISELLQVNDNAAMVSSLLDLFDDRYLGAKAVAPSVDNDGNSLLTGAMYWDTTMIPQTMMVWTGTAWTTATSSTPSTVQTLTNKTINSISNFVGADHVHYACRNTSGATINAGTVVTAQGTQSGTDYIEIVPVTNPQTQIALGVTHVSIANNGTGLVLNTGVEEDRDTSAWAVGTILYPNTTGGLTSTKPTSGRYQACAVVLRSHANQGTLLVEFTEPKYIASTTQAGYVQLNDTLTSTSTTQALTAAQGKVLQDRLVTVENGTVQEGDSVTLIGDVTGTAVFSTDGNISITATLANSGVTAGTYGSVTVDAKGRVTAATVNPADVEW